MDTANPQTPTADYVCMSDQGRTNVQGIINALENVGRKIGGWTDNVQARQTGATITVRFENKVDVFTTIEWAQMLQQCPQKLIDACEKLLLADAEIAAYRRTHTDRFDGSGGGA